MSNKPEAYMMVNRENTSAYLTFDTPTRDMKISHEPVPLYTEEQIKDKLTKYELRHAEQRNRIEDLEKQLSVILEANTRSRP